MTGFAALAVGVSAIPIVIVVWRVLKIPFRSWAPIVVFLGLILLVQGAGELIGPEGMATLIYILAGAAK